MKPEQMRSTLAAFADAFTVAGGDSVARSLLQLASLFEGVRRATLPGIVNSIEANWKESARSPRYPKELKAILEKFEIGFSASAAKAQTKDFAALLRLFNGMPDQSVDAFVLDARNAAVARIRKRTPQSTKKRSQQLSMGEVTLMAKQLIDLKYDRSDFDALLEKCGKELTATSLIAVAIQFLGHKPSAKKKADIIAAMRHRQRQDELDRDRTNAQSKIRP